jgi:hypothetical protein
MNQDNGYEFYVIFHGAFAFHDTGGERIDVYAPQVIPHVYLAGAWLAECTILTSTCPFVLTGVDPSACSGDRSNALVGHSEKSIFFEGASLSSSSYHAKFELPRPARIYCREISKAKVTENGVTTTTDWALVPVFAYKWDGSTTPSLTGENFHWEVQSKDPRPISLHIWATAENAGDDDGPEKAAELFGKTIQVSAIATQTDPGDKICGMEDREYEFTTFLPERMRNLRKYSALLCGGNCSPEFPIETMSNPVSCGPVGGG